MDPIPLKKPRLEKIHNKSVEKSDSVLDEELVTHMDIDDNEGVSHSCEKEPAVDDASSISSPNGLIVEKASHSNENPAQNVDMLFEKYFMLTDKKHSHLFGKNFGPSKYHLWGILTKIEENSSTLRRVTNTSIENLCNCKDTFMDILEELNLEYNVVQLDTLKGAKFKYVFAFDIKSTPRYSFCGYGATEDIAIQAAAKSGLKFFSVTCH